VALGYSGWGAGQLEHELAQNAWLTVPADPRILFELPFEERLPSAMERSASILPTCRKRPGMPDALVRQAGTVLAFDFGVKRIGVAVGEWPLAQAHPLTTIHGEANAERFAAIAALLKEWQPVSLVVGLPVALDGSAHAMTARCHPLRQPVARSFRTARRLRRRAPESSVEAEERLRASGHNARRARNIVDAMAAQIILQCFFERL
jgi:putative Holliday junction resolvase